MDKDYSDFYMLVHELGKLQEVKKQQFFRFL